MRGPLSARKIATFQRRTLTVVRSALSNVILPIGNLVLSFLVTKFASVQLWGEFIEVLIFAQLGAHLVSWGNKEYLLREFSLRPAQISKIWQTSLISRGVLLAGLCAVVGLLGVPTQQTILIVVLGCGLALYQSYDVLILYEKDFVFSLFVELFAVAALSLTIVHLRENLSLNLLVVLFAVTNLVKAAMCLRRFSHLTLQQYMGTFDITYFSLASPFFFLGFSGMLQSRMDLYCVSYFLSPREVGQYQVFTSFMIYWQSIAALILLPFVKNLYRLRDDTILKISTRLFLFGVFLLVPLLVLIQAILSGLYHFHLSSSFFLFGGLFVLPTYLYLPMIYALYKVSLQSVVLTINVLGAVMSFCLNWLLLPRLGMLGGVMAGAAVQWLMLIAYLTQRKALKGGYTDVVPELP